MASYQGPTRPGTDVDKFRRTGRSTPSPTGGYQGPTRPGTDVSKFRRTGTSVPTRRGSSSSRASAAAQKRAADVAKKAQEEANRKAQEKKLAKEKAVADKLRQEMVLAKRTNNKSLEAAKAVQLRESLTRQAALRGRAFTQSEARQFLGGGAGVQALRAGTAAERSYFKKTGVSLSQERERLRKNIEALKGVSVSRVVAETLPSKRPGYVKIRMPNGRIEEIKSFGTINLNKAYAGDKVVVRNGQIVQVGNNEVNKVQMGNINTYVPGTLLKAKIKRSVSLGDAVAIKREDVKRKEAAFTRTLTTKEIMAMPRGSERRKAALRRDKAELSLIGSTILLTALGGAQGITQLPGGIASVLKDPSQLRQLPSALKMGVKQYISDVGKMVVFSPGQAVAKVGTDWYVIKGVGKGIGVVGKVGVSTSRKLTLFASKARAASKLKAGAKAATQKTIARDYSRALKQARKMRANTRTKYTMIRPNTPDFQKAINIVEGYSDVLANVKARQYVLNYIKKGGKLTKSQADDFLKAVRSLTNEKLNSLPDFKRLQALDKISRNSAIKLIRTKKISSARVYAKKLIESIEKIPFVQNMNKLFKKIKSGARVSISKTKAKAKKITRKVEVAKIKRKSAQQYKKELARAKQRRKQFRKKFDIVKVGNSDYIEAIAFIDDYAKLIAANRAKAIVADYAKRGLKLTSTQKEKVIALSRKQASEFLKNSKTYKQLQNAARLNKPAALKLQKVGSIKIARSYIRNLQTSLRNIKGMRQLRDVIRKTKRKVSPAQAKKVMARKKVVRAARKRYKQTNRYLLDKNRPIRSVTIERLRRTNTITNTNKFVDDLFKEISKRRKVDITSLQFRQSKNILKKRLRRAINTGDKKVITEFRDWAKKTINDLDNPRKQPAVKVIETTGAKKTRVIRDFKPESPKGTYKEVKVGNQIQLQKVQTKQVKVGQKAVQRTIQKQRAIVKSVSKPVLSMKPLAKVIATSIGIQISKSASASDFKPEQTQKFVSKLGQDSKQDYKTIVGIDTTSKSAVALAVLQNQKSRVKPRIKTATKQVKEKQQVLKLRLPKGFTTKKLSAPTQAYYIIVKRRNQWVKLAAKPLIKRDARDYLAYSLDNGLERTAFFVPLGKYKKTAKLPPKMNGYYGKVSKKLRPYRIRAGKKKQLLDGYIEKRGAAMDTAREKAQAKRLRAKKRGSKMSSTKKKVVRKAPVRRKTTINRNIRTKSKTSKLVRKTGNKIQKQRAKRKLTPAQRKVLIQRLAKARRVKAQNAKRRR